MPFSVLKVPERPPITESPSGREADWGFLRVGSRAPIGTTIRIAYVACSVLASGRCFSTARHTAYHSPASSHSGHVLSSLCTRHLGPLRGRGRRFDGDRLAAVGCLPVRERPRGDPVRADGWTRHEKSSDRAGAAGVRTRSGRLWSAEKLNGENLQYAFVLETGYRFSPSLSLGIGYQLGSYNHAAGVSRRGDSEALHTVQVLARHKMGGRQWVVAPYLDLGVNVSTGIGRLAFGPTVGGGLTVAVDNQLSLFLESRFNLAYPNQSNDTGFPFSIQGVVEAFNEAGVPFDGLAVLPAIGVEFELR